MRQQQSSDVFYEKGVSNKVHITGLHLYQKEAHTQVFSDEFCKVFPILFFLETYKRLFLLCGTKPLESFLTNL